jgi:hypothetical protein
MKERASRSRIKFFVPFIVLLILLSSFVVTIFSSEYSQFTGKPAPVSSSWFTYTIKVYHITFNPTGYGPGSIPAMAQKLTFGITSGSIILLSLIPLLVYSLYALELSIRFGRGDRAGVRRLRR